MRFHRFYLLLGMLALFPARAHADAPGSIDLTCDVDRTQFRNAARLLSSSDPVTFRLWTDQDPALPNTQIGSDYTVPLSGLNVIKRYTDRYDGVKPRKTERIEAAIGSDGSPVVLPNDGVAYVDVTVGTAVLGCDHAATNSPTSRRRLQAVAFARESSHSETCETCTSTTDISAVLYSSTSPNIPSDTATTISWDIEASDTANLHDSSDPTRLVIPPGQGGKYLIYGRAVWNNVSGGIRSIYIRIGGLGGQILTGQMIPGSGAQNGWQSVSTVHHLDPGDSVVFTVFQDSGAPLQLSGGQNVNPGSSGGSSGASEFGITKLQ